MVHSEDDPCRQADKAPPIAENTSQSKSTTATGKGDQNIKQQEKGKLKMERKPTSLMSTLKSTANNASVFLTKGPAVRQLAVGALSGWGTGFMAIRFGKPVAFTVGGSILLFQLAHQQGFIKSDWQNLKHKLEQSTPKMKENAPKMLSNARTFAKGNTAFAAGFIGGFLIGLAS